MSLLEMLKIDYLKREKSLKRNVELMVGSLCFCFYSYSPRVTCIDRATKQNENKTMFVAWMTCAFLELLKLFLRTGRFGNLQDVESNGFAQWSTFTNRDNIADLYVAEREEKLSIALLEWSYRKHGLKWTEIFLCRFSKRLYFRM